MTNLRKAAEMAATDLEELISWHGIRGSDDKLMPAHNQTPEIKSAMETLEALRQALAQPEQEPVAWMTHTDGFMPLFHKTRESALNWQTQPTPLYTAPPKRKWVGLTDEDRSNLLTQHHGWNEFGQAIEAKLKEKNT